MIDNYHNFIDKIQREEIPKHDYYLHLVKFRDDVLLDVSKTSQLDVAKKLGIKQPQLSSILNVLKVL